MPKLQNSLNYFDYKFFLKFILLYLALDYFNWFFIGVTTPGGKVDSPFIIQYFNYTEWLRYSILYSSNVLSHLFGMRSYLELPTDIRTNNGSIVGMAYHCLGLGVMSFWIAFIITAASKLKRKILWGLGGIAAIWLINCFRVTFLLMSLDYNWKDNSYLDHHSMFNLAAYSLILIMVYLYTSKNEKQALIIN